MDIQVGSVVYSRAGRDKGDFQVIIDFTDKYVRVCDGKYRPLERPKKKNLLHVKVTNSVLPREAFLTNKSLRNALKPFNEVMASKKSWIIV